MHRRRFLASCGTLLTTAASGCFYGGNMSRVVHLPTAHLEMERVSDTEVARHVTYEEYSDGTGTDTDLLATILEDGSATEQGTEPPLYEGRPFVHDGAVYELSHEVVDTTPATSFSITLNPVEGPVADGETVDYEDLPPVDRETFERRGWDDTDFLGFGTSVLYRDADVPDSALVPEPEHPVVVRSDGTRGRFAVRDSYDNDLRTYRYEVSQVHGSAAEFGRSVREAHEFELSGLSAAERDVVESAIQSEDGYHYRSGEDSDSLPRTVSRLAERFRDRNVVEDVWDTGVDDSGVTGRYLVRYRGDVYWTFFRVAPPRDSTTETHE